MEISTNSINQPVNFYNKNTENTINMAIDGDNKIYPNNIFAPEFATEKIKKETVKQKRKKRNKRLNTMDTEYLPDEVSEQQENKEPQNEADNIFMPSEESEFLKKFKQSMECIYTKTPLINYFFMKRKKQDIEKTVETLNNINQNVDELLNTTIPYGEEANVYGDIAKNLTTAANTLGKFKTAKN